jgi:hypothetical protein
MSRISPVERECSDCQGTGRKIDDSWAFCSACDGIGKVWRAGAPRYDCKITLAQRKPGEIVTLGNGDRGKILAHRKNGTPTTIIALIGDFSGEESKQSTTYPSCVGVASVSHPNWFYDEDNHAGSGEDQTDPMRKNRQ